MCKFMRIIEANFGFLPHERLERIKSTVCGVTCGGNCKEEYIEKINIKDLKWEEK